MLLPTPAASLAKRCAGSDSN